MNAKRAALRLAMRLVGDIPEGAAAGAEMVAALGDNEIPAVDVERVCAGDEALEAEMVSRAAERVTARHAALRSAWTPTRDVEDPEGSS